jgi:hypothetical protein
LQVKAPAAWLPLAVLGAASLGSVAARAEDEVCAQAYVETQRLQRAAQFRAARQQAVTCGQDTCSATVRSQCSEWLDSIERALPTLVIDARDGRGAALAGVRVEANGELLAERLNGRALELDPGEYVLRFRYGEQLVEQRTLIRESEKYRTLEVRFGPVPEAPAAGLSTEPSRTAVLPLSAAPLLPAPLLAAPLLPAASLVSNPADSRVSVAHLPSSVALEHDSPAPIPTASYVLGGLGLASLTTFAVLASSGYAAEQHLRKTCGGACESDEVGAVRSRYAAADVALGVGVASLLAAGAVWLWAPKEPNASRRLSISAHRVALEGEF